MADRPDIVFAPLSTPLEATAVVLSAADLDLGEVARGLNARSGGALMRAAEAASFSGRSRTSIEILGNPDISAARLLLVGAGSPGEAKEADWMLLGGYAFGQIAARKCQSASIVAELAGGGPAPAELAAELALGATLRSYRFRKYLTRKAPEDKSEDSAPDGVGKLVIHTAEPEAARQAYARRQALADGVFLARDLVNEPANVLGPVEFAERCRELQSAGVEVEILDQDQLRALGMRTLLGVAQGSERPARVVVMQWHGARRKRNSKPLCFIGKGVTFDTGGISIKPAAGMEDMKGDMAGAACVAGLMLTLARRRATVDAVGLVGLVENMVSGAAQRPGDIVTSLSGQTVEVLNTDAEGRLVLADVMWYAQERFKPKLMIDLATLTGAIIVALGKEYAGLFANDIDKKLAADLMAAGEATGERVWRMPLDKGYDKLLDSKNADVKNIGGRHAGSITAAHFLGRFVKDTPWAHIDIAGVAMDSPRTEISQGWSSGWGVRLLDKLVAMTQEKPDR